MDAYFTNLDKNTPLCRPTAWAASRRSTSARVRSYCAGVGRCFRAGRPARVYVGYGAVPWGREHEIFVYRDRDALDDWEKFEAHAGNANTMIYLLAYEETQVTVVVDDATARAMASLILAMRRSIWNMSTQLSPLEKAA